MKVEKYQDLDGYKEKRNRKMFLFIKFSAYAVACTRNVERSCNRVTLCVNVF